MNQSTEKPFQCSFVLLIQVIQTNIKMDNSATNTTRWIKSRKSTFVNGLKEGSQINDSVIEQLLENASWAPSHGLVQAWHFKVFAEDGVKTFYQVQQEIYKQVTPPEKYFDFKYKAYSEKWKRVSHVIAIVAKRDPYKRFPKQEDIVSVGCAVENIYLSLQAFSIAGYLSTGDICYSKQMQEFLQLNEDDEPIGFFVLGQPDETAVRPPRTRTPATQKTEWFRE